MAGALPGYSNTTCTGALECGLLVTPQYICASGPAPCDGQEPYEMCLPAGVETKPCYKDETESPPPGLEKCPAEELWYEQVLTDKGPLVAGNFAKLSAVSEQGSGLLYRVRFSRNDKRFDPWGQALLNEMNRYYMRCITTDKANV